MSSTSTARAVVYGRSSTAKEKSIDEQTAEGEAICAENRWTVVDVLGDPISASRYESRVRANWTKLVDMLSTVDVVVLWEPSRGDRTMASWVAFLDDCREHRVRIHAVSHGRTYDPASPRDRRTLLEDGVDSEYESEKTAARVKRGVAAAHAAGKPFGRTTYGYRRVYDYEKPVKERYQKQEPHPERAKVVRDIFAAVAEDKSLYRIAKKLNDEGVPTSRGAKHWRPNVVRDIATNMAYKPHPDDPEHGCHLVRGKVYVGTWPPLVDEATWQAVHAILGTDDGATRKARRDSAPGQVKHLLSASAKLMTSPCGAPVVGHPGRPGRAAHYLCRQDGCVSVPMAEADEHVAMLVVGRLSRKDARRFYAPDDTSTRQAAKELVELRAEFKEVERQYMAPGGAAGRLGAVREAKMASLESQIDDAQRRVRPAGRSLAMVKLLDAAKVSRDLVRPTWDDLDVVAKREVVAGVFSSLVVGPVTTTRRLTRYTLPKERHDVVAARITHEWRTP
jgi:DNA invertase Pin-like site-specific DNA recombinase